MAGLTLLYTSVDPSLGSTTRVYAKASGELVIKTTAPKQRRTASSGGSKASGIGKAPKNTLGNGLHKPGKRSAAASRAAKARHAGRNIGKGLSGRASAQRCVVKAQIAKASAKAWAAHAKYIERDGQAFSADLDQASAGEAVKAWGEDGDGHMFKFIVSPERTLSEEQLREVVRETMGALEVGVGAGKLDWRAVIHTDTDQPHAHIVLRGKTERENGRMVELKLSGQALNRDLRELFRAGLTQQLGPRTQAEMDAEVQQKASPVYQRKRAEIAKAEGLPPPERKARIHEVNRIVDAYETQEAEKARRLAQAQEQARLAEQQAALGAAHGVFEFKRGPVRQLDKNEFAGKLYKQSADGKVLESATVPGRTEQEVEQRSAQMANLAQTQGVKLGEALEKVVRGMAGMDNDVSVGGDFVKTNPYKDDGR